MVTICGQEVIGASVVIEILGPSKLAVVTVTKADKTVANKSDDSNLRGGGDCDVVLNHDVVAHSLATREWLNCLPAVPKRVCWTAQQESASSSAPPAMAFMAFRPAFVFATLVVFLSVVQHLVAQDSMPNFGGDGGGSFADNSFPGLFPPVGGGSQRIEQQQNRYLLRRKNLYPYGPGTKDVLLQDRESQTGRMVDMLTYFPFYGGRYNYSIIAIHGYVAFGNVMDNGIDLLIGENVLNWPQFPDPPIISVYGCLQKPIINAARDRKGVHYRLVFRREVFSQLPLVQKTQFSKRTTLNYLDDQGDEFLDMVWRDLKDGMVGAGSFRPDAALVVTWENVTFYQASEEDEMNGKVHSLPLRKYS
ncbi:unnamed protein product [Soboliphyme baturini]|uniref:NIDO domain-containing protein n=1 Tax=Soboliphyme baturini TaxID=241478 RepID=A0A183IWJ0_9BILA|nr:unnamed protein product [Soboliphyme baturini]